MNGINKIKTLIVCLLIITSNLSSYEDYGEIQDIAANGSMQAMRAFQIQWSNWLFYTMNVNTPGFIETGAFNSRMIDKNGEKRIDAIPFYRWRAGPVVETHRPLDFYIDAMSKGFFVIQLKTTLGYTRDGRFTRDGSDRLVTVAGNYPVLGDKGPIYLPKGDVVVSRSGMIYVDGEEVDRIKVAVFASYKEMQKLNSLNGSVFVLVEEAEILSGVEYYKVVQGHIEENNVVKALVGDITYATNGYQSNAKVLKVLARSANTATQIAAPN
ncbi:MAG: hypothetical protein VW378_02320 [bacterium]